MDIENKCYDFDSKWAMENKARVHTEKIIKRKNREDIFLKCRINGYEFTCCHGLNFFSHCFKSPFWKICDS